MSRRIKALGVAAMLALTAQADPGGWQLHPADGAHGVALTLNASSTVSYRFECAPGEVIVTETGVTKLLDLRSGQPIGDGPDAVMPPGAAVMAVFGGKGDPDFQPAQAAKNPAGGWDLTIRLAKDDKQLKAVGKSEMMSLFTTGETIAVVMNAADRAAWNDFMKRCQGAG